MSDPKFYIGTSGWQYDDWKEKFYPKDLPQKQWLKFYTDFFSTVEINTCFYNLTKKTVYQNWHKQVNKNFFFSAKIYRYITQIKKLKIEKNTEELLKANLNNVSGLGGNIGPLLIQLPLNFGFNQERLERFLDKLFFLSKKIFKKKPFFSIEFRHKSWLNQKTFEILKKYQIAFCISDSGDWSTEIIKTSDWIYARFHGKPKLFTSLYSKKELQDWAYKISELNPKKAFIYFNNDFNANAVKNASEFKKILFDYFK